jgi:transcriptional regulator with XRE-family HTH domain
LVEPREPTGGAFAAWLGAALAAHGSSLRRLAEEAGVSPSALSALRTGKTERPSMETCYRLAAYLGHDVGQVLRLAGYDVPSQAEVDIGDPELTLMFHRLLDLTPEERACVKEFVHFALSRSAARRRQRSKR